MSKKSMKSAIVVAIIATITCWSSSIALAREEFQESQESINLGEIAKCLVRPSSKAEIAKDVTPFNARIAGRTYSIVDNLDHNPCKVEGSLRFTLRNTGKYYEVLVEHMAKGGLYNTYLIPTLVPTEKIQYDIREIIKERLATSTQIQFETIFKEVLPPGWKMIPPGSTLSSDINTEKTDSAAAPTTVKTMGIFPGIQDTGTSSVMIDLRFRPPLVKKSATSTNMGTSTLVTIDVGLNGASPQSGFSTGTSTAAPLKWWQQILCGFIAAPMGAAASNHNNEHIDDTGLVATSLLTNIWFRVETGRWCPLLPVVIGVGVGYAWYEDEYHEKAYAEPTYTSPVITQPPPIPPPVTPPPIPPPVTPPVVPPIAPPPVTTPPPI